MREDVLKFIFIGPEEEKELFFKQAQEEGIIHFIDPLARNRKEIPQNIFQLTSAIKVLRGLPPEDQEENYTNLDADAIVESILDLHDKSEKLLEELRVLEIEKSTIEVFGDFSFEDIAYIEKQGHCTIQFFCARQNLFLEEPEPENLLYIASEHGLDFYLAINHHPVSYEKMIEMKFDHSLSDLKKKGGSSKNNS